MTKKTPRLREFLANIPAHAERQAREEYFNEYILPIITEETRSLPWETRRQIFENLRSEVGKVSFKGKAAEVVHDIAERTGQRWQAAKRLTGGMPTPAGSERHEGGLSFRPFGEVISDIGETLSIPGTTPEVLLGRGTEKLGLGRAPGEITGQLGTDIGLTYGIGGLAKGLTKRLGKRPLPPPSTPPAPREFIDTDFPRTPYPAKVLGERAAETEILKEGIAKAGINPNEPPSRWSKIAAASGVGRIGKAADQLSGLFLSPTVIAKGTPAAESIVASGFRAADHVHRITDFLVGKTQTAYAGLSRRQVNRVSAYLDGAGGRNVAGQPLVQGTVLAPEEIGAVTAMRSLLDNIAGWAGLEKGRRISEYFPRIRERIGVVRTEAVQGKDRQIFIRVQDMGEDKLPETIERLLSGRVKPFFMEKRTLADPASNLGLEPLMLYMHGVARKIAIAGGTDPQTAKPITGFIHEIPSELLKLPPSNDFLTSYFADYANAVIGARPHGFLSPRVVGAIKNWEFARTIGANPMTMLINVTQQMNTFAVSGPRAFWGAYKDLAANPKYWYELASRHGATSGLLTKADLDFAAAAAEGRTWRWMAQRLGAGFAASERLNRVHAFVVGMREAGFKGLVGDEQIKVAKNLVDITQFRFGVEDAPAILRSKSSVLQLAGQFKNYIAHQAQFMTRDLVKADVQDWAKGIPSVRFAKFMMAAVGLGGTDRPGQPLTYLPIIGDQIKETLDGFPDLVRRGLIGSIGIHIGDQIALGTLPLDSLRSLGFFLPGPALSQVIDFASVASGMDLRPYPGQFGKPLTSERAASIFVQNPLPAGIQLDRLRKATQRYFAGGQMRVPLTPEGGAGGLGLAKELIGMGTGEGTYGLKQAFGMKSFGPANRLLVSPERSAGMQFWRSLGGFRDPGEVERLEHFRESQDLLKAAREASTLEATLLINAAAAKSPQEEQSITKMARGVRETFSRKHGVELPPASMETFQSIVTRGALTPEQSLLLDKQKVNILSQGGLLEPLLPPEGQEK